MCLLLAHRDETAGPRLWIGANRDERLDRPWEAPQLLTATPPVLGGRDVLAGGSWLAVNLEGCFAVAVTNARLGAPPGERSRGHLVMEAAAQQTLAEGVALLGELDLARYGPFNLLLADSLSCWLATNMPTPAVVRVEAATFAIGNDPLASPGERVRAAGGRAERELGTTGVDTLAVLSGLLTDHEGADPVCRHGEQYGTVCATLLRLGPGGVEEYRFAAGPPCSTPWVTLPLPRQSVM